MVISIKQYLYGALTAIGILLALLSCDGEKTIVEPVPPPQASGSIGPNGGQLTLEGATITIGAGALDSLVLFTITKLPVPADAPPNYSFSEPAWSFEPHHYIFNNNISIIISHSLDIDSLALFCLENGVDSLWDPHEDASYDSGIVTCLTNHLSIFTVGGFAPMNRVYVSNKSRGTIAGGTREDPLPTITLGMQASEQAGYPYPPVSVAEGTYREDIRFLNGISVRGGYDSTTWNEKADALSIIDLQTRAALAASIDSATSVSKLQIIANYAVNPSGNSVALRIEYSGENLVFDSCWIIAGTGGNGAVGAAGGDGDGGSPGGNGTSSSGGTYGLSCTPGGWGGACSDGGDGLGSQGGAGGESGGLFAPDGGNGGNGGNGTAGTNGVGGTFGRILANEWTPGIGGNGQSGGRGSGGGGGGSGFSLLACNGGGGGGGGGCGGDPGQGGRGGGGSMAVYLINSWAKIQYCRLTAGKGGDGGAGGNGGRGGTGGSGGTGYSNGGHGGRGGVGGAAGGGRGGPGGVSFCVFNCGYSNSDVVECGLTLGQAGAGGAGGRQGANGAQADSGQNGIAAEIGPLWP